MTTGVERPVWRALRQPCCRRRCRGRNRFDLYEVLGRVTLITMRRPPFNAVNYAFIDAIHAAWRRTTKDPGVRAIVLTSALDKAFSAGIDIDAAFGSGEVFDPRTI